MEQIIKEVKFLAGVLYFWFVFESGYNMTEFFRHLLIENSAWDHMAGHLFHGVISTAVVIIYFPCGWYLWKEFKAWWREL